MRLPESECPCGSAFSYASCCQRLHKRLMPAVSAESLMRARYAAYVLGEIDYLVKTTLPVMRRTNLWLDYQETQQSLRWISLEVLSTSQGGVKDKIGKVEFKATYIQEGVRSVHHEQSRFRRHSGEWHYVDGLIYEA